MATLLAETAHPWADVRDIRTSYWRAASASLIKKPLYNQSEGSYHRHDETKGFIVGSQTVGLSSQTAR